MHATLARLLGAALGAGLLTAAAAVAVSSAADASPLPARASAAVAARADSAPPPSSVAGAPARTSAVALARAGVAGAPAAGRTSVGHVVLVGIGGLRWSDISPTATPALWRLAGRGSDGSLVARGAPKDTCPADDWLTLNAAARAGVPHASAGPCPADPPVVTSRVVTTRVVTSRALGAGAGTPAPARVPAMPGLVTSNAPLSQNPQWGLLASAAGPGRCTLAAGPGAALALAATDGKVSSYLPSPATVTRADLARCPLTVIDLGALSPAAATHGPSGGATRPTAARATAARATAVRAADRSLAAIEAELPPRTVLVVAGLGDGLPAHLQAIIVSGPGFRHGQLAASSTRQPGLVVVTDLTPTVLRWLGRPVPPVVVGSQIRSTGRGSLATTISMLSGQDTAAQVYRTTLAPFFLTVGLGYPVAFALIWAIPWGRGEERLRRRRALARTVGVWAAALPVGTLLASLIPWWSYPHPAAVLYCLAAGWAVVVAAGALAGPWRHDPFGPVGAVASVTLGVIVLDLMTGSRLELNTPFGTPTLLGARFYGLGNNAVVIYAASAVLSAVWLATVLRRRRGQALTVMAGVLGAAVLVAAWPGFGAKVGGTIAMLPGFLLLLAATANVRITVRRALLIAVSGAALVTVFALVNYFAPATGRSDIGGFVGQALHGGAGSILRRKIGSNLHSLVENPFVPVIPVVVAALGVIIAWPSRVRAHLLQRAYQEIPLLRPALGVVWLIAVLGWFAEDSGATVPAAALPMLLPMGIVILSSVAARGAAAPEAASPLATGAPVAGTDGAAPTAPGSARPPAGDLAGRGSPPGTGERPSSSPGEPGYR